MLKLILLAAGLIVATVVVVLAIAYWRFSSEIDGELARLVDAARDPGEVVTADSLLPLPEPARRYFTAAGVVGRPIPRIVRLTQKGRIRSSNEAGWMAFEAEQTYSTIPPAFIWRTWLPTKQLPVALGRDAYGEGQGSILIRLGALVPLADEQGDEMIAAGLMRYLNETAWFPAALLGDNVSIAADGPDSFRVSITDRGIIATAVILVDAEGRLVNFKAERFNATTRTAAPWETPMTAWTAFDGVTVPSAGSATWKLPSGDFTYIELEITGITYE